MGQKYESKKKSVSENRENMEDNANDQSTLREEYSILSTLDGLISDFEDETFDAVGRVENVGETEGTRLEEEKEDIFDERKEIVGEIENELDKLQSGLRKLEQLDKCEFGSRATASTKSEYKKMIEKYRCLIGEFGQETNRIASGNTPNASLEQVSVSEVEEDDDRLRGLFFHHDNYSTIINSLQNSNVEYRPIALAPPNRSHEEIVSRVSGGDLTEGSCSSLALAYIGNMSGYDVLDFRDGASREYFSTRSSIEKIGDLPEVVSAKVSGRNDFESANSLLNQIEPGKEYYLAIGEHASIVRKNDDHYEYLELQQSGSGNGWNYLDDYVLMKRFGCSESHTVPYTNYLMEVDSLKNNQEFLNILGYINTAETAQRKGGDGNVR